MSLKVDKNELKEKNKIVDNAILQLKKEFIGIDEQIDSIMDNVRVWYLYPHLQTTPCVINIFGMTGCGKTSLVRRIASLLDVEDKLVYFNFCAINEMSSFEVEDDIEEQLADECSNRIFVYDEFQYAATINSEGEEKDNKHGLKPFWELLDTGILHKRSSFWSIYDLQKLLFKIEKVNAIHPINIKNGVWINHKECLSDFSDDERNNILSFLQTPIETKEPCEGFDSECPSFKTQGNDNFFIQSHLMYRLSDYYRKIKNSLVDITDMYDMMRSMSLEEICQLISEVYKESKKGFDLKFNNSLIFVIANLDEAYDVAFNVNPDMSPDQFNKITSKISIVDIKNALKKRFRNEQIARLGNIHITYPSFNTKSFEKIIDLHLEAYKNDVKEKCGLDIEFDSSIKKTIFNEAVYPTHGTRPIFSTIYEIVKTKLPYIIRNIVDNNKDSELSHIIYSFKNKKSVINVVDSNGKIIDTYKFNEHLRLDKLRESDNSEEQACTAVHESGHFVIYSYLKGKIPEKIISRSADKNVEGFMMENVDDIENRISSYENLKQEIMISLGGYAAEGLIFGSEYRSNGSSSDLYNATKIASSMIRKWGMGDLPFVSAPNGDSNTIIIVDKDKEGEINRRIQTLIKECLDNVDAILKNSNVNKMLRESSKYLSKHSSMPKHIMTDLFNNLKKDGSVCANNDNYYRNIVNKL